MSETYKVVVVGMGKRGKHHASAFHANPRFKVVGICDIDASRLEAVAADLGNPETSSDAADLATSLKPDVFCFCTMPDVRTDMIKTGAKSFAVIKLKDGTRITIRPDSQLGIKKYNFEESEKDEAEYELVKGGMRALTGLMGKSNPDATSVKT